MAAVLLGVVERWLSHGPPRDGQDRMRSFGRTDLRGPRQAFARTKVASAVAASQCHRIGGSCPAGRGGGC